MCSNFVRTWFRNLNCKKVHDSNQRYTNDLLKGKILSEVYLGLGTFFRLKWFRLKWHMNCQTKCAEIVILSRLYFKLMQKRKRIVDYCCRGFLTSIMPKFHSTVRQSSCLFLKSCLLNQPVIILLFFGSQEFLKSISQTASTNYSNPLSIHNVQNFVYQIIT